MKIDKLIRVMASLRAPEGGCPWDREQTFHTIYPYTIEEAYEVADAIERGDMGELREELGDLLFQVVFHAQMAQECGLFGFEEVVESIVTKMIRRHPHVFDNATITDSEAQTEAWEAHKAKERQQKSEQGPVSELDGVALALPALLRAKKLQKRAAKVGFDWPLLDGVMDKVQEEMAELEAEVKLGADHSRLEDELGDLLFSCVNLSRHLGLDPEHALRMANDKFERRFRTMERSAEGGSESIADLDLERLEELWQAAKEGEAER